MSANDRTNNIKTERVCPTPLISQPLGGDAETYKSTVDGHTAFGYTPKEAQQKAVEKADKARKS